MKALLLSSSYEVLAFIQEKKVIKLVFKGDKVDVISSWDESFSWSKGTMNYPSILKLKEHKHINRNFLANFSRGALIKRDQATCQYCNLRLSLSEITIDHVVPKSHAGPNNFSNCVVSCKPCNLKKANRTPDQAGMKLLKKPIHPSFTEHFYKFNEEVWHKDWDQFIKNY